MKLTIKDLNGKDQGELEIGFPLIEGSKGTQAVHDTVVAYLARQRMGTACTKTRAEVAGSGKKPWRQKGTGRARVGSIRSPLWRGGGIIFGPRPRDFSKKVNRKTRRLALRKALTERIKAGDVLVVDELKLDSPKTKGMVAVLERLGLEADTVLIVATQADTNLRLATRNLPLVDLMDAADLNTYQVLRPDKLLFTRGAFEHVQARLQD